MSSDITNGISSGRASQMREVQPFGYRPNVGPTANLGAAPQETSTPEAGPVEGYAPTAAIGESPQDRQAGEAQASQILSAWDNSRASSASAGRLEIQNPENTTVHQVHSAAGGQYVAGAAPESVISGATVYKSTRPA